MRNLLLLLIVGVCVYLYMHPQPESVPVVERTVAAAPQTGPRFYYHSPLDAPAMRPGTSTGMGYYSAEASSQFDNYQHHSQVGGGHSGTVGTTAYGGGSTSNTSVYYSTSGSNLNNAPRNYGNGNTQSNGSYQGR